MTPDELRQRAAYVRANANSHNIPLNLTLAAAIGLLVDAVEMVADTAELVQPTEKEKAARENELYWTMRVVEEAGASPELTAVTIKLADRMRLLRGES